MNEEKFQELINLYNSIEEVKFKNISNKLIQLFNSNAFDNLSYKRNIEVSKDITNFIDEMHEGKKEIKKYNFSKYEYDKILEIYKLVEQIQLKLNIKNKILPINSLVSSFGMIRIIEKLNFKKKKLNIFEIGPGSFYTGTLLIKNGHNYTCTDNTQGFYLWQSIMFKEFDEEFVENFEKENSSNNNIRHMPWWEFLNAYKQEKDLYGKFDIVICDHTLGEINRDCLNYVVKLSKMILNKNEESFFIFRSPGANIFSSYWEILRVFKNHQFEYVQFSNFIIFFQKDSILGKRLKIFSIIPTQEPNSFVNNIYLKINRLIQFLFLKVKRNELHKLKNFDNRRARSDKIKNYKDIYNYVKKKNMLSEKEFLYSFFNS